jgi:ABC-2 type transport system permease protein
MFAALYRFELRYQLTRPGTWFYFVLFAAGSLAFVSTDTVAIAGGAGQVMRNAPWVIVRAMLLIVVLGQIAVSGLVGNAVLRDYQARTHELVFTTPITRWAYLGGRFFGAVTVMVIVHLGMVIGMMAGPAMPWVDRTRVLPLDLASYLVPFFVLVVPALLVTSAIYLAVGVFTRSAFAIHTQGIVLLVVWSIAQTLVGQLDNRTTAALLDPVGLSAFDLVTRYWTVAERNTGALPLRGLMLVNRVLWSLLALGLAATTVALFRFRSAPPAFGRRKRAVVPVAPQTVPTSLPTLAVVVRRFGWRGWWVHLRSTARMSFHSIVRQLPFGVTCAVGFINLAIAAAYAEVVYGQRAWPVTYTVVEVVNAQFALVFTVLITLYAGELVWRERELGADQVVDALPSTTSATMLGKLLGLLLVEATVLALLMVAGMLYQVGVGYTRLEPWLYVTYLFGVAYPPLVQLTVLAVLIHVVVNQKYIGHALVILAFLLRGIVPRVGLEHPMFRYAEPAPLRYSDMNGYGPYLPGLAWTTLYWTAAAVLLGVAAYAMWVRGTEVTRLVRARHARQRWRGPVRVVAGVAGITTLGAGGVLFHNTNRVNVYRTTAQRRAEQAAYERTYKPLSRLPQPRLIAVDVRADLVPERLSFAVGGTYTFVNNHARPLDSLVVSIMNRDVVVDTLEWGRRAVRLVEDAPQGIRLFRLATPLAPNDTITLRYHARYDWRGFPAARPDTSAVSIGVRNAISENGTFLNFEYFPILGYLDRRELATDDARRKEGLGARARTPSLDDEAARAQTYMGYNADWITFRAVVSTAPDQVALAPGELVQEYREGGRRVFEYRAADRMLAFYSVLSARYAVRRDSWNGIPLEVYYHPGHEYNLDRMLASMKASLQDFSTRYAPFQFTQMRIVEFPRYSQFAQAFPGMVPFSENLGFILKPGNTPDDIDTPYYVTAHEVAHQWWFHQVIGGNVQGSTMLSEALANYSAILVMEQTFGPGHITKFLREQLDAYLVGRARETKAERPLMLVENQGYIHYSKGSLALYALRDLIGDSAMTQALRRFVADKAFRGPPFPTSRELIGYLEAETPDSVRYALDDLFRTITLWDHAVEDGRVVRRADGKYDVSIHVRATKWRADSLGNEVAAPKADLVDIAVFGAADPGSALGKPLYLAKHRIAATDTTLLITVDAPPQRVGIDPYNKLIDRNPQDNVMRVRAP